MNVGSTVYELWLRALGVERGSVEFDLRTPRWWPVLAWGVGLAGIGQAGFLAWTGRFDSAGFMLLLALGWLRLMVRAREKVWLGRRALVIPGRPVAHVRFGDLLSVDPVGGDGLRIKFRARYFGLRVWGQDKREARFFERDAFVRTLFRRIAVSEGVEFADRLRSR